MTTPPAHHSPPPKRVLVVDDVRSTRVYLRAILEDAGLIIHEATSGNEALERLQTCEIDLVLMDFRMPDMDGAAVVLAARTAGLFIPRFVMMSADDSEAIRESMHAVGVQTLLKKPVVAPTVLDLLKPL